jgi:hypothetical protein
VKTSLIVLFVLAAFLAVPSAGLAQVPIPNPTGAEWDPSVDHAQISSYELGYYLAGATDPVQTVDLGKPDPGPDGKCRAAINVRPLGFAVYTARIKAKAGPVASEWSDPSNPFARVPEPARNLVVK